MQDANALLTLLAIALAGGASLSIALLAFAVGQLRGQVQALRDALDRLHHTWPTLAGIETGQFKIGSALRRLTILREHVLQAVEDDSLELLIDLLDAVEVALDTGQRALAQTAEGPTAYREGGDG